MSTENKHRAILAFAVFCLLGLVAQSLQLQQARQQLAQQTTDEANLPSSIEQRLLNELDKQDESRATAIQPFSAWPFAGASPFQSTLDSLFMDFPFSGLGGSPFTSGSSSSVFSNLASPEIEIVESDEEFRVLIPSNEQQEIELNTSVENNSLSVSGVITEREEQVTGTLSSNFVSRRQFARTIDLPAEVDELGVLTRNTDAGIEITLPKKNS